MLGKASAYSTCAIKGISVFFLQIEFFNKDYLFLNISVFFLMVIFIAYLLRNIFLREKTEQEMINLNLELSATYEQLEASSEELQAQYDEIQSQEEVLARSRERYMLICEASAGGYWDLDLVTKESFYTENWYNSYGFSLEDISHTHNWEKCIHTDDIEIYLNYKENLKSGKSRNYSCEYRIAAKDGDYKWFVEKSIVVYNMDGRIIRLAGTHTDITEKKLQEKRIERLAYYDTLTRLPNRTYLNNKFAYILDKSNSNYTSGMVMFIDVDQFKLINDFFGHEMGDGVLIYIGDKLTELFRNDEKVFIYKFGGDEYVILIEETEDEKQIKNYIDKTMKVFEKKFVIDNNELYVTVSMGVVLFPQNGNNPDLLFRNVDTALNKAKESGKNCYKMFENEMNLNVVSKMLLQNSLKNAIQNNEFILYYQPQIDALTNKLAGYEALIRWVSPKHGFVQPNQFIKVAEEIGTIVAIGKWVLRQACEFCKKVNAESYDEYKIAVNISPIELMQYEFVDNVKRIIMESGINPALIEIEITESALMESFSIIIEKLIQLKEFGVSISLDDFGTGYSSLNYLKQLPIDTLKIDKSFIDDLETGNLERYFIDIIISLAHRMNLKVIAEGVETKSQSEILAKQGCDRFQGYLFSKPLTEEDAINYKDKY